MSTSLLGLPATVIVSIGASILVTGASAAGADPGTAVLPESYGPAPNGPIAYAAEGDIYTKGDLGENATLLISGSETDAWPAWSRDGSRLMFERRVEGAPPVLMLADADGSDIVSFADIPGDFPWSDWAPDGVHFVVEWVIDGEFALQVLTTDHSEPTRTLDLGEIGVVDLVGSDRRTAPRSSSAATRTRARASSASTA